MNEWEWQLLEDKTKLDQLTIAGVAVQVGDRVRLRPRQGGDVLDIALAGQVAVIESIEQDYEGKSHVCVVLEDDPGRDLGMLRQPGHRFFFDAAEVDPLPKADALSKPTIEPASILVAGIGNIFLGDDGFGVEVIRRLAPLPQGVTVKDFGIRSYDLAYALLDRYDVTILVDAAQRGGSPGDIYLIEPEVGNEADAPVELAIDAHAMNPVSVLRLARSMGPIEGRILVVACEPEDLGGEEGKMGLSAAVSAAAGEAAHLIEKMVARILDGGSPEECIGNRVKGQSNGSDTSG
jgi:hydrogenase maturation protease